MNTTVLAKPEFKTWKTIKLGTGLKTADDFREAIENPGMRIDDDANDIVGKPVFKVAESLTEVELVVVSVAKLGLKDGATSKDIYACAEELGIHLCPPEVGPQLRLQYVDQPKGEWLEIAMEPITNSNGHLNLFSLGHIKEECNDDDLCLVATNGCPDEEWSGHVHFVFLRRK